MRMVQMSGADKCWDFSNRLARVRRTLQSVPSRTRPKARWGTLRCDSRGMIAGGRLRGPCSRGVPAPANLPPLFQNAVVELFAAPVGGGLHERQNHRMRLFLGGGQLRLKEHRHKKAVRRRFDGADFALRTARDHGESGLHGAPFKFGIHFEIAKKLFSRGFLLLAIKRLQIRTRAKTNLRNRAGKLGRVALAARHGARDGINHDVFRTGIVLGGVGVLEPVYIAREFEESVLESSASAQKRPVATTGELNPLEHAVKTLVGAARRSPEAVEAFENFFGSRRDQRGRGDPLRFDRDAQFPRGLLDRISGRRMRAKFRVEVAQNPYAGGIAHMSIVLERFADTCAISQAWLEGWCTDDGA